MENSYGNKQYYFAIERSRNGKFSAFAEVLGTVKGADNSSSVLEYIFYDEYPYSGISYYRIKQTDYDDFINYQVAVPKMER